MAEILREGGVRKPVVVNEELRVLGNSTTLEALRRLGVKLVPVTYGEDGEVFTSLEELGFYEDVSPSPLRVYSNTLELLYRGWPTPLVRLQALSSNGVRVWAKLEGFNPYSWSIKDRIGWYMFVKALESLGERKREVIYEATSTNTGLALAAMAAIQWLQRQVLHTLKHSEGLRHPP